jgi:hypothetical protein
MAMIGGMLAFFALWFFKDGQWTWPEERRQAEVMADFKRLRDDFDKAKAEARLPAWTAEVQAKGYPLTPDGMLIKSAAYAAQQGWAEDPKLRTPDEIQQQFYYAGGAGVGAMIVGMLVLLNRKKKLVGEQDHFVTPEGVRVNFADVFRVDKRKWDNKGLAYVSYYAGKAEKKAVIDDLKYDGAAQVLDRVVGNFTGELIEKEQPPDDQLEGSKQDDQASS